MVPTSGSELAFRGRPASQLEFGQMQEVYRRHDLFLFPTQQDTMPQVFWEALLYWITVSGERRRRDPRSDSRWRNWISAGKECASGDLGIAVAGVALESWSTAQAFSLSKTFRGRESCDRSLQSADGGSDRGSAGLIGNRDPRGLPRSSSVSYPWAF